MNRIASLLCSGSLIVLVLATVCNAQSKSGRTKKPKLPAAVAEALKGECPDCTIAKSAVEKEHGIVVYDFEFRNGQGEMDVAADGTILEREKPVPTSTIPAPALEAIRNAGGSLLQVETDEVRAEIKDRKIVKLDTPKIRYEADLVRGNKNTEVVVTPEGQVAETPKWKRKNAKP
ncbi:MAG TPA: hypothetical protein VE961_09305 [Pyrinomonadaceae bacterium]|nr:hypothetical protein [Pyrinomonadaceae bacterium]